MSKASGSVTGHVLRLDDEYVAAQERGEVVGPKGGQGTVPTGKGLWGGRQYRH